MKHKLMAVLLLLSQIVITSPTKLTKEDLQKTIADFQEFKYSYECENPEKISLFLSEDMRSKHKTFRSNIAADCNCYMYQTQFNADNIQNSEKLQESIHEQQLLRIPNKK